MLWIHNTGCVNAFYYQKHVNQKAKSFDMNVLELFNFRTLNAHEVEIKDMALQATYRVDDFRRKNYSE